MSAEGSALARVHFGDDVWEHAYDLKDQNRRADYLKAWWTVVDWEKIGERYSAAKAGPRPYRRQPGKA